MRKLQNKEYRLASEPTPWGDCEVWQDGTILSLYLHNKMAIQSQLNLSRKETLLLEHSRAMMSFLLFQKKPKSVLLLGLGGGSIIHFLSYWFPQTKITAVDVSEQMVNIAKEYFEVEQTSQVNIHIADAFEYLNPPSNKHAHQQNKKKHSILMVDIHDGRSIPNFLREPEFIERCYQSLTPYGILVMNLLIDSDHDFLQIMGALRQHFTDISVVMPLKDQKNIIVFAFKSLPDLDIDQLRNSATKQQEKYNIEFTQFISDIVVIEPK